jgi:hypothetical protein
MTYMSLEIGVGERITVGHVHGIIAVMAFYGKCKRVEEFVVLAHSGRT